MTAITLFGFIAFCAGLGCWCKGSVRGVAHASNFYPREPLNTTQQIGAVR